MDEGTKKAGRTAIQKIAGTYNLDVPQVMYCEVLSVDKSARTCKVKPLSSRADTEIDDVGLMAEKNDGEFKIPTVGSTVGVLMSTQVSPHIVSWSDLDEWYLVIGKTTIDMKNGTIKLGDGSYDGLVKVASITEKLNNIENLLNTFFTLYNAHTHPYVNVTTPATTSPTTSLETQTLTPTQQSDIENNKITHGKTT